MDIPALRAADSPALRKARGAFFTPSPIARYITDWAVRTPDDQVLEPSCGEAAFLLAAADRLRTLGHDLRSGTGLHGVDIHEDSAKAAHALLRTAGADANITISDFFLVDPEPLYDTVVGNPPFVRYQDFSGDSRTRSRAAALRAGVPLTQLASSWAAFTVHAALFLKSGGRLGLVLPAELLSVNYAGPVRTFLMERFSTVRLVAFGERVFPGVLEDVVLLLADGYDPTGQHGTDHCEVAQALNAESLGTSAVARRWKPVPPSGKWTASLLSPDALTAYASVAEHGSITTLEAWGDTTLGMVTGNNRYFALSADRAAAHGLTQQDVVPLSPPGSRHLRGLTFTDIALKEMAAAGSPVYLFRSPAEPSAAARAYIAEGEAQGVQHAYKCRVRSPWWRVPLVPPADLLLTYMNADTPRLCTNRARVHHLNSVHGVYLKPGLRALGMDLLPFASLNSLTLLGAETVGRAYGGGMLKLEPREADRLPVPSPELLAAARKPLTDVRPQLATALRGGKVTDAAKIVDQVLLVGELGLARSQVRALRDAHAELTARRVARGAEPSGKD